MICSIIASVEDHSTILQKALIVRDILCNNFNSNYSTYYLNMKQKQQTPISSKQTVSPYGQTLRFAGVYTHPYAKEPAPEAMSLDRTPTSTRHLRSTLVADNYDTKRRRHISFGLPSCGDSMASHKSLVLSYYLGVYLLVSTEFLDDVDILCGYFFVEFKMYIYELYC
ncbi:hypothetical protein JTE90_001947 [Oedothorax gibbosus]|uniref:Uncharacterized protein n=1 Tax=Oedothorax gibbosus TaxID=931172 RepID=A0AAV6VVG5_9ARAC|nr:hypothetical protein JTE90_001947 [Oedothorax gibbosus]